MWSPIKSGPLFWNNVGGCGRGATDFIRGTHIPGELYAQRNLKLLTKWQIVVEGNEPNAAFSWGIPTMARRALLDTFPVRGQTCPTMPVYVNIEHSRHEHWNLCIHRKYLELFKDIFGASFMRLLQQLCLATRNGDIIHACMWNTFDPNSWNSCQICETQSTSPLSFWQDSELILWEIKRSTFEDKLWK